MGMRVHNAHAQRLRPHMRISPYDYVLESNMHMRVFMWFLRCVCACTRDVRVCVQRLCVHESCMLCADACVHALLCLYA